MPNLSFLLDFLACGLFKMCFFLTSQMHHTNIMIIMQNTRLDRKQLHCPAPCTGWQLLCPLDIILRKENYAGATRHDQILHIITVLLFFSLSLWCVFAWPTPFTATAKHATCYKNGTGCSMWRLGRWPTNGPENESCVVIKHHSSFNPSNPCRCDMHHWTTSNSHKSTLKGKLFLLQQVPRSCVCLRKEPWLHIVLPSKKWRLFISTCLSFEISWHVFAICECATLRL